jgi:hypothetical protein
MFSNIPSPDTHHFKQMQPVRQTSQTRIPMPKQALDQNNMGQYVFLPHVIGPNGHPIPAFSFNMAQRMPQQCTTPTVSQKN